MNEHRDEIIRIIKEGSPKEMQTALSEFHPSDIADCFKDLDDDDQMHMLLTLNHHLLAEIFSHLKDKKAARYLVRIDAPKVARILDAMDRDDATDIMESFSSETRKQYLSLMDDEAASEIRALLHYGEETAGSIMTTEYIVLKRGMDVKDAMKALVGNATDAESIQRLFVIDDNGFLEGVIELKKLIQARTPKKIDDIMKSEVITVKVSDHTEEVARTIQNYGIYLLPVVNEKNMLKGVITMDDAADILDQETDEDYARFATISAEAEVNRSVIRSAMHRLPWLTLLLALGLIVSGILSGFEETIEQITVLVFFLPLILGMAGNTGTQSLAVTVRGLSKSHYHDKAAVRRHVLKELRVGVLNGIGIGLLSFVTSAIFLLVIGRIGLAEMEYGIPLVSVSVAISVAVALVIATTFGAIIPLTLNKMKIDPAVASGPFITTINDIVGLVVYFTIAAFIILNVWGA